MSSRLPAPQPRRTHARLAAGALLAVTLAGAALSAAAQPVDSDAQATSWSLGVGVISRQKPYAGIDRDNVLLPMLRVENRYVSIFGPTIAFKLPAVELSDAQRLEFALVGRWNFSGYEADDAPVLTGMAERKGGLWAGARAQWRSDWVDVGAEWLADLSGDSNGRSFSVGVEKTFRIDEQVQITPRVTSTWYDRKYVDYYYGVRAGEATAGRPAYAGGSGRVAALGVRGVYRFDNRHSVFLDLEGSRLPDSVRNSPLVDRSSENRVFAGYLYRFR